MTLEQRVEALEMAIANMSVQQSSAEGISEIARKVTAELNANACRPGCVLNAAQGQTAAFKIGNGYLHISPAKITYLL